MPWTSECTSHNVQREKRRSVSVTGAAEGRERTIKKGLGRDVFMECVNQITKGMSERNDFTPFLPACNSREK